MSFVNVTKVDVLDNPAKFTDPFKFDISFECGTVLKEGTYLFIIFNLALTLFPFRDSDLEWKLVYVGSADTTDYDQEIESIFVGPGTVHNRTTTSFCLRVHV